MAMDHVLVQAIFTAILSTLASSQSCVSIAPDPTTTTRVLLDTYNLTGLPWTNFTSDSIFHEDATRNCRPFIEVNGGAFEVATNFITKPAGLLTVSITIDYEGQCGGTDIMPSPCIAGLNVLSSSAQTNDRSALMNSLSVAPDGVFSGNSVSASVSDAGFQLYFFGSSISMNITRVRVTYEVCLEATVSLVRYGETIVGRTMSGTCVGNSTEVSMPLMATCQPNAMFTSSSSCECDAGYGLHVSRTGQQCDPCDIGTFKSSAGNGVCDTCPSNSDTSSIASTMCPCNDRYRRPSNDDGPCSECTDGNFMSNSMCQACPEGSESNGGTVSSCTCMSGFVTRDEVNMTSESPCNRCTANRFRQNLECMPCPGNSERVFSSSENICNCTGNAATSGGQDTTTTEACTGCVNNFYLQSGSCTACPSNSFSMSPGDTSCKCDPGTDRESGNTDGPCSSCAMDFYRDGNGICVECPLNSQRLSSTESDDKCVCKPNYARQNNAPNSDQCSPHVWFSEATISFNEGGNYSIPVRLSAPANSGFDVPISVNPSQYVSGSSVSFTAGSIMRSISVNIPNNDVALEDTKMFSIELLSSPEGVVGVNANLSSTIEVNINDDDNVDVGFTVSTARYNESSKNTNLQITRQQEIANSFTLKIESNADLVKLSTSEVTITPMRNTETVPFEIVDNVVGGMGDRTITLTIMYSRPSEYMNSVIIGGGTTHNNVKIVITEDDASVPPSPFPVEGIIGAAVAAAGLAVLLLVIIILCFCIFRLQANRQGFYPTHEDKTTEAPTMIRYSASLRSISSQTVMGISEGKSVPRENEFYV